MAYSALIPATAGDEEDGESLGVKRTVPNGSPIFTWPHAVWRSALIGLVQSLCWIDQS